MPDQMHLKQLQIAGQFCLFDKKLRSSGNSSMVWGILNILIGGLGVLANNQWAIVSLVLGVALFVAGAYERRVRDPKVIIVSAATLGSLAIWNFALIALAASGKLQLALGGRTLYWAIAQLIGAFATWKTYSTYKLLQAEADPAIVQQVHSYIDELKKAKVSERLDLVEFEMNSGFLQGTKRYRLMPFEDLYIAARYRSQFGSLTLVEEVLFVSRSEVMMTTQGEKWMSKKLKATVQLGSVKLENVTIQPDMAMRISPGAPVLTAVS